jgi:quinoprotein glucose dehydrogenase
VPGEQAWPTQPFPTRPPPFAKQTFSVGDVNPWLLDPDQLEVISERVAKARNEGIFTPPSLVDTISMPGNQGGSNWGTTAADPKKGLVFVVNVNEVAILKLEDVRMRIGRPGTYGSQVYQKYCQACHGSDQPAAPPASAPTLADVTNRLSEDTIRAAVTGGTGTMRPVQGITDAEITALLTFLTTPNPEGRGAVPPGPPPPPGPVVASGGVPLPPPRRSSELPPTYAGIGGTGGNIPYPDGVEVPPVRYVSEYGVMASATSPPYTTLTAYDLNAGTIKWQVPIGDDPLTLARGGPQNTGGLGARNGMFVTRSGLVFVAGGDGKARAFDEETGQVLWTGTLPGNSSGIPVSYEAKGRQYVVFSSLPRGAGRGGRGGGSGFAVGPEVPPDMPRGYIAFALPQRERTEGTEATVKHRGAEERRYERRNTFMLCSSPFLRFSVSFVVSDGSSFESLQDTMKAR